MTYLQLAYWHLGTVVPAFLLGSFLMLNRKGTSYHRILGKAYMVLMLATAIITLFMTAEVGPQLFNHFGFIHIFSGLVFYNVPQAYRAARKGEIEKHRGYMRGLYFGAILIAGAFALMPGRLLHGWIFG